MRNLFILIIVENIITVCITVLYILNKQKIISKEILQEINVIYLSDFYFTLRTINQHVSHCILAYPHPHKYHAHLFSDFSFFVRHFYRIGFEIINNSKSERFKRFKRFVSNFYLPRF